jgi:hypothetical protein
MEQTARFALPQLAPGQAQKEFFHNEALQQVDMMLCPAVEGAALSAAPANPAEGTCYLVAAGASGAWAGKDGSVAGYTEGGWRFVAPIDGVQLFDRSSGQMIVRRAGSWETGIVRAQEIRVNGQTVLRGRQGAIANPVGGAVVDAECRSALSSLLAAARAHGLIE